MSRFIVIALAAIIFSSALFGVHAAPKVHHGGPKSLSTAEQVRTIKNDLFIPTFCIKN
jgi:hypothetical protein